MLRAAALIAWVGFVGLAPGGLAYADAYGDLLKLARTSVGRYVLTSVGVEGEARAWVEALQARPDGELVARELESSITRIRARFDEEWSLRKGGPATAQAVLHEIAHEELAHSAAAWSRAAPRRSPGQGRFRENARELLSAELQTVTDRLDSLESARRSFGSAIARPMRPEGLVEALDRFHRLARDLAEATASAQWERRLSGDATALERCRRIAGSLKETQAWIERLLQSEAIFRQVPTEKVLNLVSDIEAFGHAVDAGVDPVVASTFDVALTERASQLGQRIRFLRERHRRAVALAIESHDEAGQLYAGSPYSTHLRQVRGVLKRYGYGPKDSLLGLDLGTIAWLHDIVEDTQVTVEMIERLFGQKIGDAVAAVTNEPKSAALSKLERKRRTLERIAANEDARLVKLADRIANVEESRRNAFTGGETKIDKYLEEWPEFRRYLYRPGEAEAMWSHLQRLLTDVEYARAAVMGAKAG